MADRGEKALFDTERLAQARDAALACAEEACRNMDGPLDFDAMVQHFTRFAEALSKPFSGSNPVGGAMPVSDADFLRNVAHWSGFYLPAHKSDRDRLRAIADRFEARDELRETARPAQGVR